MEDNILEQLKKMGKITDEDIVEADSAFINPMRAATIEKFHSILCVKNHPEKCKWYDEDINVTVNGPSHWERVDHSYWKNKVVTLKLSLNTDWDGMSMLADAMVKLSNIGDNMERILSSITEMLLDLGHESLTEDSTSSSDDS